LVRAEGDSLVTAWETVIGLEVHAQLLTRTKLFCGCTTVFGRTPNSQVCEVCLGMPGVLPVPNARAVELAVRAGLALGCTVHDASGWSRKNYFYPDLPKGYQISQYDRPICTGGALVLEGGKRVGITRIHIEEDAGKNVHDAGPRSYVDFNRGGTPLVEIVSEPDLRSPEEAGAYVKALRQLLRYIEVCDGNMEEGSLRCDANVSIRPRGAAAFGTRVEIKNLNSFRFIEQAIAHEAERQAEVLAGGGKIVQETRLWDTKAGVTRSMRSKEEAHDYRYFPEPDLPDLLLARGFVDEVRGALPELPAQKLERYVAELGLSDYDARVLIEDAAVARFFEAALAAAKNVKAVANWVINELLRELRERDVATLPFGGKELGELVQLIDDGTISGKIAKEVFSDMLAGGGAPKQIVEKKGLVQVSDAGAIEPLVDEVLAANPDSVAAYRAGKTNVVGFLVGQIMKKSGGKANPKLVNELLRKKLS
jgi:aspartyl-tRNA(Asn)/glutamyl-tRNA(Gln) amidotransferase subunit B